eukprot:15353076-Heterocapsa_arctica.AAC.1
MDIDKAKKSKRICAHLEKTNFDIPTRILPNIIDLTDAQTNHRFFYGPQVRIRAMAKAKHIQAHKRDKHNKAQKQDL